MSALTTILNKLHELSGRFHVVEGDKVAVDKLITGVEDDLRQFVRDEIAAHFAAENTPGVAPAAEDAPALTPAS